MYAVYNNAYFNTNTCMNENQKQDIRNEKVMKRFYIQNVFKNTNMKFITIL